MPRGILGHVYRSADGRYDTTNGGVTSRAARVVLVGAGVEGPFEAREDLPALLLSTGHGGHPIATPLESPGEGRTPWMFGGNFIYSSDSRFPSKAPIPVHDRSESWTDHRILSR